MNPTLQGYAAAVLESVDAGQLATVASELNQIEQLVLATPALRAALSDTAVSGPARRAVLRDLLEGKVTEPARRLAAFAAGAVAAPDVLQALAWVAHRAQRDVDGVREAEPPLSLTRARAACGRLRPGALRDDADRGVGGDGGQPLPLRPHRRVRPVAAHRADRSRPTGGVPPGPGGPVAAGKGHGGHLRPGGLRGGRGTGPRLRGHPGLAGRADRPRPWVAHRPGALGGGDRGSHSGRGCPTRCRVWWGRRSSCRSSWTRRC